MDKTTHKHESYAMLQINRTTTTGATNLFGSSIKHSDTIRLQITEGKLDRHLNRDWYHGGKQYIEIEMSNSQFAEAITSLNQGSGVPVTLKRLWGRQIKECPHADKRQEFEDEFRERMEKLSNDLDKLTEHTEFTLYDKKTINKADKELILSEIKRIKQEVKSNMPFIYKSFNEQMDKTVLEAKGEIEGFMMNKIIASGLNGLQKEIVMLNEKVEDKNI